MVCACPLCLAALMVTQAPPQQPPAPAIELRPGLVISQSARIVRKTYRLTAPASLDSALITIQGDDVTVDFQGATLQGRDLNADPDQAQGVAIRVARGRNIRIVNARVHGFKVGLLARGTANLTLLDNDLSDNWKPRLYSLVEHESLVDWLSFHHNEQDEWLRYGAAIYLVDVHGGLIHRNRARRGMNGLLLVRSNGLRIQSNVFSFNSGVGIGLYRSSRDTILHNLLDYNVRGYSHGFYSRGQDSADLLMYEQSSNNVVAYNSMTHGGDGVFLWAGQSTMDSGSGGANDNVFFQNDVSYATANGIEATFSRNTFVANKAWGSEYGLWGGYSYSSAIVGNDFARNRTGIAIEHGQDNTIVANRFAHDSTAIRLWGDSIEPSDWGYPKYHDTESHDYRVSDNVFVANRVGLRASRTRALTFRDNRLVQVDTPLVRRDSMVVATEGNNGRSADTTAPAIPSPYDSLLRHLLPRRPRVWFALRDRSWIVVDEWGPYDWEQGLGSAKLWPVDSTRAVPLRLRVLGNGANWRVIGKRGIAALSKEAGRTWDTIAVTPKPDSVGDWELTLESTPRAVKAPGAPASAHVRRFSYGRFEPAIDWDIRFFAWTDSTNPRKHAVAAGRPIHAAHARRLDYMWYRPQIAALPRERWALEATGTVTLAPGSYTLRTISDDGVRVWVDGALVIDAWDAHESRVDSTPIGAGRHELRVAYYQNDGWTELRLEILRRLLP
jgi:parallel beta-helix repeat protein